MAGKPEIGREFCKWEKKLLEYNLWLHLAILIVKRQNLVGNLVACLNSCGQDTKEESSLKQLPRKYI